MSAMGGKQTLASSNEALFQKAIPALLRPAFDREAETRFAAVWRPIDHSSESGGHLRFERERCGVHVRAISEVPDRPLAVTRE
jgi:hypothetical protein